MVPVEETNRLNLSNLTVITPHLISRKYRPVYQEWSRDKIRTGDAPTKLNIFRMIETLETNPELMINEDTYIPLHITLNIVNEHETVIFPEVETPVYAALSTNPVKPSVSSNPSTPSSYKKPKDYSGYNPNNPKPKQNNHNNSSSKSGSRNSSKSPACCRQASKSPSRGRQMEKNQTTTKICQWFQHSRTH